jgi:uncharacterized membrane protein YdjX (TVP38/TMEM64 family)
VNATLQRLHSAALDFIMTVSGDHKMVALAAIGIFLIVGALVFIPRQPICLLAGFLFGVGIFPFVLATTTLGCVVGFLLSRYVCRSRFRHLIERQRFGAATMKALGQEGWWLMFMLRLASPVPGAITNYLFGLTDIGLAGYTLVSFLGLAPQSLLFVYLGAVGGAAVNTAMVSTANTTLAVAGIISFVLCTSLVARRVRLILANYGG